MQTNEEQGRFKQQGKALFVKPQSISANNSSMSLQRPAGIGFHDWSTSHVSQQSSNLLLNNGAS